MNKKFYNNLLLFILILSDFISGIMSLNISFYVQKNFPSSISQNEFYFILVIVQLCWSIIFFFANLYNTRATLSRFDEIIRLVPIIYSTLFLYIALHVFGIINLYSDFRNILTYGIVFSTLLISYCSSN